MRKGLAVHTSCAAASQLSKSYHERLDLASIAAADYLSAALDGFEVPLVCGCPTGEGQFMVVRQCFFSRHPDGPRLAPPRSGSLWGSQAEFIVDERNWTSVGQMTASVYGWELEHLGMLPNQTAPSDVADAVPHEMAQDGACFSLTSWCFAHV
jgi:hypothetical protein